MRDSFNNIVQKTNEFNLLIEDLLNNLPDTPKNYKLKKQVEGAYRMLKMSLERHEDLISDSVPPVKIKMGDYKKEFIDTWSTYKDYMVEQFGIRMRSRMQKFRLQLLFDLTDNDIEKSIEWLKYYMAAGSSSIYPVNEFEIKQKQSDGSKEKKAGFVLPGKRSDG
jgi:hypothetical protein